MQRRRSATKRYTLFLTRLCRQLGPAGVVLLAFDSCPYCATVRDRGRSTTWAKYYNYSQHSNQRRDDAQDFQERDQEVDGVLSGRRYTQFICFLEANASTVPDKKFTIWVSFLSPSTVSNKICLNGDCSIFTMTTGKQGGGVDLVLDFMQSRERLETLFQNFLWGSHDLW